MQPISNSKRLTPVFALLFAAILFLSLCLLPVSPGVFARQFDGTPLPIKETFTPVPAADVSGCQTPPDDYSRVWQGYARLNARTLAMLDHAQELYEAQGGILDFRQAITQGSYTGGALAASFGTHDGGGAVDLSVRAPVTYTIMVDEIEPMIRALRVAGFAAWLRDVDELYPGSVIHIHAVAVGDREQSAAARAQIDGTFGYLRGYDGLPRPDGIPVPDRYGGPVICPWMIEQGYVDLRGVPYPTATLGGTAYAAMPGGVP